MFDRICTSCHKRQLIFPTQVTSMVNTDQGILVTYTCWCGATQEWQTGRAMSERDEVAVAA